MPDLSRATASAKKILVAELEIARIKLRYATDWLQQLVGGSSAVSEVMVMNQREKVAVLNQEVIIAQARLEERFPDAVMPDKPTSFEEATGGKPTSTSQQ